MMHHICCLVPVLLLLTLACAQADQPSQDQRAQAPPTPEPQAGKPRAGEVWSCEVPVRHPAETPPNNRLAHVCGNHAGRPRVITRVACITEAGSLRFTPELTGAGATSILATPLTCTPTWAEGVLNGAPRVRTFSQSPMTCAGSCTIDFVVSNITAVSSATLVITGEYD